MLLYISGVLPGFPRQGEKFPSKEARFLIQRSLRLVMICHRFDFFPMEGLALPNETAAPLPYLFALVPLMLYHFMSAFDVMSFSSLSLSPLPLSSLILMAVGLTQFAIQQK